jgi:hypothetical protein
MALSASERRTRRPSKRAPRVGAVSVTCGMCSGSGRVIHHRATQLFGLLTKDWQTTAELARRAVIGPTNAANVLAVLLHLGLVDRVGSGANRSPFRWRRL